MSSLLSATMIVIENSLVHYYLYFTAHSTSRADQVVKREICSIITKGKISVFCISNLKQDLLCNCHKFIQIIYSCSNPSHSSHPSNPSHPSHPVTHVTLVTLVTQVTLVT